MTPQEKVADIYAQAAHHAVVEKVASDYGVEHLPGHFKEALCKEAIIPAGVGRAASHLGGSVARGLKTLGSKFKPGGKASQGINRLSDAANTNKAVAGGLAGGAALTAATTTGFAAGRASKK